MESIRAKILQRDALPGVKHMRGRQYQILLNIAFCPELKFVCTIPTQNIKINLHSKPLFSRIFTTYMGNGSDSILGTHHKVQSTAPHKRCVVETYPPKKI